MLENENKNTKRKRLSGGRATEDGDKINKAVTIWFVQMRERGAAITGAMVRTKATEFAEMIGVGRVWSIRRVVAQVETGRKGLVQDGSVARHMMQTKKELRNGLKISSHIASMDMKRGTSSMLMKQDCSIRDFPEEHSQSKGVQLRE